MHMTLGGIADLVNGQLIGDPGYIIEGAGPIESASARQITFAENKSSLKHLDASPAGAALVPPDVEAPGRNIIKVSNPRLAFAKILSAFHPIPKPECGIHPSAVIGQDCRIGKTVSIGPGVVIGDRAQIGDRVVLYPNTVIGDQVVIDEDSILYPNVTIMERCLIGKHVIIHSGAVIGCDGFGFVQDNRRHFKIPQTGIVQIDDHVEIGANTTIDRATFGKTWIKTGVKTDNLVHIAHNVVVGENTLLIAQAGVAGSSTIGRDVILAGQCGVGDHLTIGDNVIVAPRTGVGKSIPDKQIVSGAVGHMPHGTWLRFNRILPHLPEMAKKIAALEKKIALLENDSPTAV